MRISSRLRSCVFGAGDDRPRALLRRRLDLARAAQSRGHRVRDLALTPAVAVQLGTRRAQLLLDGVRLLAQRLKVVLELAERQAEAGERELDVLAPVAAPEAAVAHRRTWMPLRRETRIDVVVRQRVHIAPSVPAEDGFPYPRIVAQAPDGFLLEAAWPPGVPACGGARISTERAGRGRAGFCKPYSASGFKSSPPPPTVTAVLANALVAECNGGCNAQQFDPPTT